MLNSSMCEYFRPVFVTRIFQDIDIHIHEHYSDDIRILNKFLEIHESPGRCEVVAWAVGDGQG